MSLVTADEILKQARKARTGIAAINLANYETAAALFEAAEIAKLPLIVQMYTRMFENGKAEYLIPMLCKFAERSSMPIAIHLDHGSSLAVVKNAIQWGCTSVMYDGSNLPMQENIANTVEVVKLARKAGVSVEAEIGHVAMGDEGHLTQVEEAVKFMEGTGVDFLAVAIGTAHGYYRETPKLDVERCQAISEALPDLPLVLHGGTGTPHRDIQKVIRCGVSKINVATEYQDTFLKNTRAKLEFLDGKFMPIDKFMDEVREKCVLHAVKLMKIFALQEKGE